MTRAPVSAGCARQRRDPYKEQTRSTRAPYCTAPPQDEKITTKQTNKGQTKTKMNKTQTDEEKKQEKKKQQLGAHIIYHLT